MTKHHPLIDLESGVYAENTPISLNSGNIRLQRMQGGPSDGVDIVEIDNGRLQLSVLPTRGMGIWRGQCGDLPLKWDSPVKQPVHPAFVDQSRRGGIGWLDGFNELICRCGLGWHGAPGNDVIRDDSGTVLSETFLPLHGRIANLPAHNVVASVEDSGDLKLTGVVDECSVFGERLRLTSTLGMAPGASSFSIHDEVTNLGGNPADIEILYHCNFGMPLLSADARFHTAVQQIAPRDARAAEDVNTWDLFREPQAGYAEQVYFMSPISDDQGRAIGVLAAADGASGVALRFHTDTLPCLTLWKNTQSQRDGYCCGIEPSSSLPNNRGFEREQGRVMVLDPGESRSFRFEVEVAETASHLAALLEEVQQLQTQEERTTHSAPQPSWSPA